MSNQNLTPKSDTPSETPLTPLRCLTGAAIAAAIGFGSYSLTTAIATTFAAKPIHSDNRIALNISSAVRTLVVGMTALATVVFGIIALGLVALAIQTLFQQLSSKRES